MVNLRWYKGGGAHLEIVDAYKAFDTFEKHSLRPSDLKRTFADYLDHPVTDQDINDIMAAVDKSNTGQIGFNDFKKFYFS